MFLFLMKIDWFSLGLFFFFFYRLCLNTFEQFFTNIFCNGDIRILISIWSPTIKSLHVKSNLVGNQINTHEQYQINFTRGFFKPHPPMREVFILYPSARNTICISSLHLKHDGS